MSVEDEFAAGLASAEVQDAVDELAREVCEQVKALTRFSVTGHRTGRRQQKAK
ncbi:hypothetical protein [Mycobacterium botniense]|uniref:Uncharacterized protein n=1 Tax=Mycobacterium botniense TaxID=84962 RepID=A0A7I9XRX5_9MYCO|nr:hypothetical protein [Mycobacterium botniense]GFG72694.1 hypothetical protein MBOT_00590 [Mycobacterium botniense]